MSFLSRERPKNNEEPRRMKNEPKLGDELDGHLGWGRSRRGGVGS
jgi:hypothetical protein